MSAARRSTVRRCAVLWAALALGACAPGESGPEPVEVHPYVAERTAELLAGLPAAPEAPATEPVDEAQLQGLLEFVATSSGDLRRAGLTDLAAMGAGVLPELVARARDASLDGAQRVAALDAVAHGFTEDPETFAEPAVDLLLALAKEGEEPWLRSRAAWFLGAIGLDRCLPDLVLRLKYEKDGETVVWIAQALSRFGNFAGLTGLIAVANDPAQPAAGLAAGTGAELAAEFGFPNPASLAQAWSAGDPEDLLPPLDRSNAYRARVLHWIGRLGEYQLRGVDDARFVFERLDAPAAAELAGALFDESPHVRLHAAQSLGRMGARGAVAATALARALGSTDIAPTVAEALGRTGHYPSAPELELRLAPEYPLELRVAAARGLARLGLSEPLPGLLQALDVPDEPAELRQALAEAAAYSGGGPQVAELLLECIDSPRLEPSTSLAALGFWLGRVRDDGTEQAAAFQAWRSHDSDPQALAPAVRALLAQLD